MPKRPSAHFCEASCAPDARRDERRVLNPEAVRPESARCDEGSKQRRALRSSVQEASLPAIVGEGLVSLGHFVQIFAALD